MKYLQKFEGMNEKYQTITEEDFVNLFKENCKNFSFGNDPLYRGDEEKFIYGYHNPIERKTRAITYIDFFAQKDKDLEKYPVVRKNSLIGVGGDVSKTKEMIRLAGILGDNTFDGYSPVYRIIPFDNSELVFCPIGDLKMLDDFGRVKNVSDDDFIKVSYTENFKVPVDELNTIQKRLMKSNKYSKFGFEFFISSPCLMINIKNEDFLKNI